MFFFRLWILPWRYLETAASCHCSRWLDETDSLCYCLEWIDRDLSKSSICLTDLVKIKCCSGQFVTTPSCMGRRNSSKKRCSLKIWSHAAGTWSILQLGNNELVTFCCSVECSNKLLFFRCMQQYCYSGDQRNTLHYNWPSSLAAVIFSSRPLEWQRSSRR